MIEPFYVLHVDDCQDEHILFKAKLALLETQLHLDWASSSREARKKLSTKKYECIVSDFQMPGENGLDFLEWLRASGFSIPFIFLTGQGSEDVAASALRAGANDYFTKEVGFAHYDRLINCINRAIQAHKEGIERKAAEHKLEHLNLVLKSIRNVNQLITCEKNPVAMLSEACRILIETRGYRHAWIARLDNAGRIIDLLSKGSINHAGMFRDRVMAGSLPFCLERALKSREIVQIQDINEECNGCVANSLHSPGSALCSVLAANTMNYGVISVSLPEGMALDAEETSLFRELVADLSFALHKIDLEIEKEATEAALIQSELLNRTTLESISDAVFITDDNGRITFASGNAQAIFGLDYRQLMQMDNISSLFSTALFDEEKLRRDGVIIDRECEITDASGRKHHLLVDVKNVTINKGTRLFTCLDITPRRIYRERMKKAEDELSRKAADLETMNKELEAFTYTVAHDLRAPVRHIQSYVDIIVTKYSDHLNSEISELLKKIHASGEHMLKVMEALLNLSKVTADSMNLVEVNLTEEIKSILAGLREEEPDRHVTLQAGEGITGRGDVCLLRIALENLLKNAWKFTSTRENAVIEFNSTVENGEVIYHIKDNGVGFAAADSKRLFIPFSRLPDASHFEGSGIGLATVKRIINIHHGRIWANGEPGKGAAIHFTLGT